MTHEDDTRDLVRRAGDAVPVSPAPVHDLLQQGRGARRRRTVTTLGVVAASVAFITTGAVAVGVQLTGASTHEVAAKPTISEGTLVPKPGIRFVGRNGIAVAVPAKWRTSKTTCHGGVDVWQLPASYRGPVSCGPQTSKASSLVNIQPYSSQAPFYLQWARPFGRIGGTTVQRSGPFNSCLYIQFICPAQPVTYTGVLLAKGADVLISVSSSTRAQVTRILDSAFAVPAGYVAMTPRGPSSPIAFRALGLHVTERPLYQPDVAEGSLLSASPPLGSVVARGSDVTLMTSTHRQSTRCWASPVEVVGPRWVFRPSQGLYVGGPKYVHVGDHLTLRTIGPCGNDVIFAKPPNSVLTRINGREVVATHRGSIYLSVIRPGALAVGDVEVHVHQ